MGEGWKKTETDTVWYSPSALSSGLYISVLRHVPRLALFKGYVKSRGHWCGLSHSTRSERSNCVGGTMEKGDRDNERGREQGKRGRIMGV